MVMVDINRLGMRLYMVELDKKPNLTRLRFFVGPR